jgi:hypothetical protein
MIKIMNNMPDNVIGATAMGEVTDEDYESTLIPVIEEKLKANKKIRLFYHLDSSFTGFEVKAVFDDAKMGIKHLSEWDRIALVSDHNMINAMARFFGHIFPCPVRIYKDTEFEDAKKWIIE